MTGTLKAERQKTNDACLKVLKPFIVPFGTLSGRNLDRSVSLVRGVLVGVGVMAALGWFPFRVHCCRLFCWTDSHRFVAWNGVRLFSGMIEELIALALHIPADDVSVLLWHPGTIVYGGWCTLLD